jgi:hypothetical protein
VASAYDAALNELYQAPLPQFIAERKRLAGELKAKGNAAEAKELATKAKPPISAWVVNQLWWHARDAFDDLLKSAEKLRKGQLAAQAEHRDAIAKLRKRATSILEDAGNNANEATLRRITTTLSAIAATGGFEPDAPGTLSTDRDPPGFEAVGIPSEPIERPAPKKHHEKSGKDELAELRDKREAQRERDQAEKKAAEEEKKRKATEKHRLEAALRQAKLDLHDREREVKHLEKELRAATDKMERAQERVDEIAKAIDDL